MDTILYFIGALAAYALFSKLTAPKVENINGTQLDELLKDKTVKRQFIDVRTLDEFQSNKIKGFKNIPLQVLRRRASELKTELPLVLICASGSRSMRAARLLNKMGYKNLVNVKGGMNGYKR